jgi:predicted AAA+ superfamily ATPase
MPRFTMYKKRAIEATINKTLNQFPVILLSGPRQVGKTTVLRQLLDEKYSYVTMDDPVQRRALNMAI